jgi:hypothetical protein
MSPGGATCIHSNAVLLAGVLSLTPNSSPEERRARQEWIIMAFLQSARRFPDIPGSPKPKSYYLVPSRDLTL